MAAIARATASRRMKRTPDVVVDAFAALVPGGGIGRFVRLLDRALRTRPDAPRARYAVTRNLRRVARERYREEEIVTLPLAWRELALAMMIGARTGMRFDSLFGHPAVMHSTVGYGPRFRRARLINQVHDLTFYTHPQWHTGKTSALLSATAPVACRSADVVLTDCEFVRGQVIRIFGASAERVRSVPLPLDPDFRCVPEGAARALVARTFGLNGAFVLHVSTIEPRKNQIRLVEAFEALRAAGFPGPLVLAGPDGWKWGPIAERIRNSPAAGAILRVRDVSNEDLVALYRASAFTVFPSLSEGFGYPLLESMACGRACVTSDHAALLELGGDATITVPAEDAPALGDAMIRLWRDEGLRLGLEAAGLERSKSYAFETWAGRMFEIYRTELAAASAS